MPLIGGGGAGNTAGSNPTGTSSNLNYIGEHAYAYSGDVSVGASLVTLLEFSTAEQYIVGSYQIHGLFAQIGNNQVALELTINGQSVVHSFWTSASDNLNPLENDIILPPFSSIRFQLSQAEGSDRTMQLTFQGRVYNA